MAISLVLGHDKVGIFWVHTVEVESNNQTGAVSMSEIENLEELKPLCWRKRGEWECELVWYSKENQVHFRLVHIWVLDCRRFHSLYNLNCL
ncbi:hypothetical protein I3760_02G068500 [Carya illinoinensis]|nr:hypothetical protein I3760_02G068500 [Carya illinoinensis]